jgi:hypothetical protein
VRDAARYATAVHESSHALCAIRFDFDVDRLTIATDGARGRCAFRCQGALPGQKASIFLAGIIGELLVEPATDMATARHDLTHAGEFGRGLDLGAIARRTRQLLRERWGAVIKLASALARDGELDALAIRHLTH